MFVHHFVLRHRKVVVRLMMRAAHQQSDEAKPADVSETSLGSLAVTVSRTPSGRVGVVACQPFN